MTNKPNIITIDGPSGSGKGAISSLLAKNLGWHLLDSGAVYRILALAVIRKKTPLDDVLALKDVAANLQTKFIDRPGKPPQITLDNEDITDAIRSEKCSLIASKIAAIPEVRAAVIDYLRSFAKSPGLVADGRDMGTVVFPDAKLKIFLTANIEERAKRRLLQLQEGGISANLPTILQDLKERDARDQNRAVAPLKPASDAVIVDTTKIGINEVLQLIMGYVKSVFKTL